MSRYIYRGRHQAGDAHVALAQPAHTANLDKDIFKNAWETIQKAWGCKSL